MSGTLPLSLTLALREMRGGLNGFYIFILCVALGVASIAGIQSLAHTLTNNLSDESASILGGNAEIMLIHREANDAEFAWITQQGEISAAVTMRAMARIPEKQRQTLVEIKAVDTAYPLIGKFELSNNDDLQNTINITSAASIPLPVVVASSLLDQLEISIGDIFTLGSTQYRVADIIKSEPDRLSGGLGFGPRVLMSIDSLRQANLIQPGTLMNWRYRIKSDNLAVPGTISQFRKIANETFPEAGWRVRGMGGAAPGFTSNIQRFAQFLTLIGITTLLVGGIGIANAVRSFIDSKKNAIATLKSIGATQNLVYRIYLWQILLIALIGIGFGLILGSLIPFVGLKVIALFLPLGGDVSLFPDALALGALFGLLTTLTFSLVPLAQTERIPVTALFRGYSAGITAWPRKRYFILSLLCAFGLITLAIVTSYAPIIAAWFILGSVLVIVFLWFFGRALMSFMRRLPKPNNVVRKLAFNNINRPDALTPHVTLSLGLGLTLLVTITLIDRTITNQMLARLPESIPSFFFIGIQNKEKPAFDSLISELAINSERVDAPMLRGRIMKVNGTPSSEVTVQEGGEWVLRGDRGITFSNIKPEAAELTQGEWWPADYEGENLVSFKDEEARELGLQLGDTVTINVLGRNITATISNFRKQEWESLSINFVMVFSPNTFRGAPYPWLSTLTFEQEASDATESEILKQVTQQFPSVTSVRVKTVIESANNLVGQVAWAFRSASAVTIIAAMMVLGGALAAGHRHRLYDAVLLKTLGATKIRVLWSFILEYIILGLVTAIFAICVGSIASYLVTNQLMELDFKFDWAVAILASTIAVIITVGLGLISTWRVLRIKPAQQLRTL